MGALTRLSIVIVNWNSGQQLRQCLRSIEHADKKGFEFDKVVVVDNGSIDGSADGLLSGKLPIEVVRNFKNTGFAAACNQGAKGSQADFLLFLNPDTSITRESLVVPLDYMSSEAARTVGICGVRMVDEKGVTHRSCTRFPTPGMFLFDSLGLDRIFPRLFPSHFLREWDHMEDRRVDHVIGAFYLMRREIFEAMQGFDERFFVYLEDLDFSKRAHDLGWETQYLANPAIYHKGGGSSEQVKAKRLFYATRSRILYGFKHFAPFWAWLLMFLSLTIEPLLRLLLGLVKGSLGTIREVISGYRLLYQTLPETLASARKR